MRQVDRLLEVQDIDTVVDQLRHRRSHLPEQAELSAIEAKLAVLASERATQAATRDEVAGRQNSLAAEVATAGSRIHEIEKRLYSGSVSAARDLQVMTDEVEHLKSRRSTLEDAEMELLEAREPIDADLAEIDERAGALEAEASRLRAVIAEEQAALDVEIGQRQAEREAVAIEVGPELTARYEKLRAHLGGVGAARVEHGSCMGCHLSLPATEVAHMKKLGPDEVATCEQCGRILIP